MPQRERRDRSTKRATGKKQTPAQKSAAAANLAKGRAAKKALQEARKASGESVPAGERWRMLLSGQITVKDLDDQEIKRMKVRSADGSFSGSKRTIPSHLATQFAAERIRRAHEQINKTGLTAIKELTKMATDPDVDDNVRARLLVYLTDRVLGKTPETVRVEGMSGFDKMLSDAVGVEADLDLDAELEEMTDG